eukprot:TRINITY_DN1479_c0_g1_i2.p1 TRINITY_DN1479_c0_g1~~TRINITY_DN1479_c0_g1_i2.p1  ORF type:complete len:213 (-),score=28.95 TRINITY_DN1479_c0_g1_i2:1442-2080(-)
MSRRSPLGRTAARTAAVVAMLTLAAVKGLVPPALTGCCHCSRAYMAARRSLALASGASGSAQQRPPQSAASTGDHQQQANPASADQHMKRRQAEEQTGEGASGPSEKKARSVAPKPMKPKVNRSNLLIIGLGNPGDDYAMTRHNIGFLVADELSRRWGCALKTQSKFQGLYGSAQVKGKSVGVLKPSTFMNNSGQAARKVRTEPHGIDLRTK